MIISSVKFSFHTNVEDLVMIDNDYTFLTRMYF